jgi:translocation and assembly module TamB
VAAADPAAAPNGKGKKRRWKVERDWGAWLARLVCALFAVVGIVPLAFGGLVRMERVQSWAARETSELLEKELGVVAHYDLEVSPWPLEIVLENVVVPANDGGGPFLRARGVMARPRLFSLLAGKLDFGEVEIEEPELRAVVREGALQNLDYRLPESTESEAEQTFPISALSLTNAAVDVTIDDARVRSSAIDIDLAVGRMPSDRPPLLPGGLFELSLRAGATELDTLLPSPDDPRRDQLNEDALCGVELRVQITDAVLVRRMLIDGAVDFDPAPGSRPSCKVGKDDWRQVQLELESVELRLDPEKKKLESADGRAKVRLPTALAHRAVAMPPVSGWVELEIDEAHYDSSLTIPEIRGKLRGGSLGVDSKIVAHHLAARVETERDVVHLDGVEVAWAGGGGLIDSVEVRPLEDGAPLSALGIELDGLTIEDMLDDLAAHPRAHVHWAIDRAHLDTFGGTLDPLHLEGHLITETSNLEVYDRPHSAPTKRVMMGHDGGIVSGTFKVEPYGVVLSRMTVATPRSHVLATVALHFDEVLGLTIHDGSSVDLAEISPLVDIPMRGTARVAMDGLGSFGDPRFGGMLAIDGFEFGGFRVGDLIDAKFAFKPLEILLTQGKLRKNKSFADIHEMLLDFDEGDADVVVDAHVDTRQAGMRIRDFFEILNMVPPKEKRSDGEPVAYDPRWQEVDAVARGDARVNFVLGGKRDRCGEGRVHVRTAMQVEEVLLYGLRYDTGAVDVDWLWDDMPAGDHGLTVRLRSGVLRKGNGTVAASASIDHGAKLKADIIGSAIPLDDLQPFRDLFRLDDTDAASVEQQVRPEATMSFVATLGGTLPRLAGEAEIDVSSTRIGPDILPASRLSLEIVPDDQPVAMATSRCNNAYPKPVKANADDDAAGYFVLRGRLFGDQVRFNDLQLTRQKRALLSGEIELAALDLGALANLYPGVAFSAAPPRAHVSAKIVVDELPIDDPSLSEVRIFLSELEAERAGDHVRIGKVAEPLLLSGDALHIPSLPIDIELASKIKATVAAGGDIENLSSPAPGLALDVVMPPVDLSQLGVDIPQIDRAEGMVAANLTVGGTIDRPRLGGRLRLDKGMLRLKGVPLPLDDIHVDVRVSEDEIRIRRANAKSGNTGRLELSGRLPLDGLSIGGADATLIATDVKLPVADGVKLTADARLHVAYDPLAEGGLPSVTGRVTLKQLHYTRPMNFQPTVGAAVVEQITNRRRDVESYNPEDDFVTFDVSVVSPEPVRIANNLVDMRLEVVQPGIQLSGTNQRFGARGALRVDQSSKLFLQRHHFQVQSGTITFDNPTRIAPHLDVHASTEYRRYQSSAQADAAASADTATASAGGRWRIAMHAYGELDAPEVRFTSDPPLGQEDIVLLLQVGQTRAELERGLLSGIGQAVGLEALSAVTGLDKAFKDVPLIDEFRVGSQYSSRTGRPEPTLTFGKRLTDSVRATLTTGLSENREVRSNIEWQLKGGVSVSGSYDNVNEVGSSSIGNVGAGLRWRLEFE